MFIHNASVEGAGGVAEAVKPLRDQLIEASAKFGLINSDVTKIGSKDWSDAMSDIVRVKSAIAKADAQKAEADRIARLAEIQNANIAKIDSFGTLSVAVAKNPKDTASVDQLNAVRSELINMVNGSAKVISIAPSTNGEARVGTKKEAILSKYVEYRNTGKSDTQARKDLVSIDGFNDGTMGIAVKSFLDSAEGAAFKS